MKIKTLLVVFFIAITTGCATQSKKEDTQTSTKTTVVVKTDKKTVKQPAASASKPESIVMIDVFTCKKNGDVREIYIEPLTPKGCKLWYSNKKGGPTASSILSIEHCEKASKNIRKNLETSGFKCEAVENTTAHSTTN